MSTKEEFVNAILKSASLSDMSDKRKRLTCAEAFELAIEFEREIKEVGRICNQHNIRICKCQLGCFL